MSGMMPARRLAPLRSLALAAGALCSAAACGDTPGSGDREGDRGYALDPQLVFWDALQSLCGRAFEGRVTASVPADEAFEDRRLVMHVRECDVGVIRIPFHVGDDRARTWILTTTAAGLHLEHEHRHEDGTEDEISGYGGATRGPGAATEQRFHADGRTAELVPAAASNVWTIEIHPDSLFGYALRREGSDRRFRAEFDLGEPVEAPPPPWGSNR